MSETLQIDDLSFVIKRSPRRKSLGIIVERDGSLVARVPQSLELETAQELIRHKMVWVHSKLAERQDRAPTTKAVFRRPEFIDGEGFYFLGKHYRLRLIGSQPGATPRASVHLEGDRMLLRRDRVQTAAKRIEEFYTRAAHPYLNDTVARWKSIVGVTPARFVQVMDLGFRWGSCSSDGTLYFHWRIMQLPVPVIDYLVVHELTHLKINHHSQDFWAEVARVLPNYEDQIRWLKKNEQLL